MIATLSLTVAALTASPGVLEPGGPGEEAAPTDLVVGHWVEVRGGLDGGRFVAAAVELLQPQAYELLIGTAERAGAERFFLLGQEVKLSEKTEWKRVERSALEGARVKVEGHYRGPRNFSAREVANRGAGRDRIGGRIDEIRPVRGGLLCSVMRFEVFVPADLVVEAEGTLAELALAPARPSSRASTWRQDKDEDDLFGAGIELLEDLRFNGQLELDFRDEGEFDLDDATDQDRRDLEASARIRFTWRPSARFGAVAEGRFRELWRDDDVDGRSTIDRWTLGETWVWWGDALLDGLDVYVGRQDFDEPREWIYDQNLDAVRLVYDAAPARVELSVSSTLGGGGKRDEAATNLIAYVSNGDREQHLAAWAVLRDFDLGVDEELMHYGARALGEWWPGQDLWLELAGVTGERGALDVSGWGYDVGTTWTPDFLGPFALTVGYAYGSGDDDAGDGTDHTFRQTGLQDNNDKFTGVTSFRYYGELLDPELANLGILTVGVGTRLFERTSLDLVFHQYTQDRLSTRLVDTDLDARPTGLDGDLGWELDLILGSRRSKNWDIELVGGWFRPGDAFLENDDAFLARLQVRYRF